jgi:hypothetical protein
MEKLAGKAAGKPELESKGEQRQVCRYVIVPWIGMAHSFVERLLSDYPLGDNRIVPVFVS